MAIHIPKGIISNGDQEVTDAKAAKDSGLTGVWLNRKMAGKYEKVPEIISLNDLIYSAP